MLTLTREGMALEPTIPASVKKTVMEYNACWTITEISSGLRRRLCFSILILFIFGLLPRTAFGQMSPEEAQRRLEERIAARQQSTARSAQVVVQPQSVDGPAIGTWKLVITYQGHEFPAKVAISSRDGTNLEGYIDDQLPNGPLVVEALSGLYHPETRKVELWGYEIRTSYDEKTLGPGTHHYEAFLSADGSEMRSWTSLGNPGNGSAKWDSSTLPGTSQRLTESCMLKEDRFRALQQDSVDFKLDGLRVLHGSNSILLRKLENSNDSEARRLAKVALALKRQREDLDAHAREFRDKLKNGMPTDVFDFLSETLTDALHNDPSISPIVNFLNSDLVQSRFDNSLREAGFAMQHGLVTAGLREYYSRL